MTFGPGTIITRQEMPILRFEGMPPRVQMYLAPFSRTRLPSYPSVPQFLPGDGEHRRQIARALNSVREGKVNVSIDVTLNANATTTTLTDARIGASSSIFASMPMTASAAAAWVAGIYVTGIVSKSATINHASNAATDQTIRFIIVG